MARRFGTLPSNELNWPDGPPGNGGSHPDLATHDALGLATQTELDAHGNGADPHTQYQKESEKGQINGYASLDGSGTVPDAQISAAIARDAELHAQNHAASHAEGGADEIIDGVSIPSTQVFGDAPSIGADTAKAAPRLHKHGMPADPVTAHVAASDPHTGYRLESVPIATPDINNNAVDLTKLLDIATATFVGRTSIGSGDPEVLTVAEATALLNLFSSALKGLVPASGGGTANFLRADGIFATPPGGGGGINTLRKILPQTINAGAGVFTDIDELTFPVTAGINYAFFFYIAFRSAFTTTGWKASVNGPAGTLDFWAGSDVIANAAAGVATHTERHNTVGDDMTLLTSTITANVDLAVRIQGRYLCTASGTFAARFANELASNNDLVVQKGSWGWWF